MEIYRKNALLILGSIMVFMAMTGCGGSEGGADQLAAEGYRTLSNETISFDQLEPFEFYLAEAIQEETGVTVDMVQIQDAVQQIGNQPTTSDAENTPSLFAMANSGNMATSIAENLPISAEEFKTANIIAYNTFADIAVDQGLITIDQADYEKALLQIDFDQIVKEAIENAQSKEGMDVESRYYELVKEQFDQLSNIPPTTYQLLQLTLPCNSNKPLDPNLTINPIILNFPVKCINNPFASPQLNLSCDECDIVQWTGSGEGYISWGNPIGSGGTVGPGDDATSKTAVTIPTDRHRIIANTLQIPPCSNAKDRYFEVEHQDISRDNEITVSFQTNSAFPYFRMIDVPKGTTLKYCGALTGFISRSGSPNAKSICRVREGAFCPRD